MRKAAPELSREMDELRKERKTLVERRCYVTTAGVERGDAVQQRIADIDAKVTALYARAKEQLVTVTAKDLTIGASTLRFATNESKAVRDFIAQETKRHSNTGSSETGPLWEGPGDMAPAAYSIQRFPANVNSAAGDNC